MKSKMPRTQSLQRWISASLLYVVILGVLAGAFGQSGRADESSAPDLLPGRLDVVPPQEADRIAPWSRNDSYGSGLQRSGPSRGASYGFDAGTVMIGAQIGSIVLDLLVNLGKAIWQVIEMGKPKTDIQMDVASAVPDGINHWTELQGWQDPTSKLYHAQLLGGSGRSLGDLYFRLIFAYGGNVGGKGKYLANVTIVPAQIIVPYGHNFYARTKVTHLLNHGTKANPLAGMTLLLTWGQSSTWAGALTEQSVSIHVKGNGRVLTMPSAEDVAEDITDRPGRIVPGARPRP